VAKELPFFKFEPSEWMAGRIQRQPVETQATFINLCCKYWHKLGELSFEDACLDFGKTQMDLLLEKKIIGIDSDYIFIKFLDAQLEECAETSKKNSIKGLKSAEIRALRKLNSTVVQPQLTGVQPNSTEEKRKEEKRKEEKREPARAYEVPFVDGCLIAWLEWEQYLKEKKKKLTPSTAKKQFKFLGGRADPEVIAIINQSIEKGWQGLFEINKNINNGTTFGKFTQTTLRRADATIEEGKDFGKL